MFTSHPTMICSGNSSFSIDSSFNVWVVGDNKKDQLGYNQQENIKIFRKITFINDIKMITCGTNHSLFLTFSGEVYFCGFLTGIKIKSREKLNLPLIQQIGCCETSCVCLSDNGDLYTFGLSHYAQLGHGTTESIDVPSKIESLNNIDFIVCGGYHVICKNIDNQYYSWGYNTFGQLGQGDFNKYNIPTLCNNWCDYDIKSIKCGSYHSVILTNSGQIYTFGYNGNGQLGFEQMQVHTPTLLKHIPEIKQIECGFFHNLLIDIDNNLWVFGSNYYKQQGLETSGDSIKIPTLHPTLKDIIDTSSGASHVFIKTSNNEIYAYGNNENSQLGKETKRKTQTIPIQVLNNREDIWSTRIGKSRQKSARK